MKGNNKKTETKTRAEYSFQCPKCGKRHLLQRVDGTQYTHVERCVRELDSLGCALKVSTATSGDSVEVPEKHAKHELVCEHCHAAWNDVDELFYRDGLSIVMDEEKMLEAAIAADAEAARLTTNALDRFKGDEQMRNFRDDMFWGYLEGLGFSSFDIFKMDSMAKECKRKREERANAV